MTQVVIKVNGRRRFFLLWRFGMAIVSLGLWIAYDYSVVFSAKREDVKP